jgi:nickel-dependent lactate racemase
MGIVADNPRRRDINEAVEIAGLDMKIDAIVNIWGETVAIHAGAPMAAFSAALEDARVHYLTPSAKDRDIVFANSYAKVNEAISGLMVAFPSIKPQGGDAVLIANAPEGQITHYLMGPFGNEIGGKLRLQMALPPNINRLIIYSEYPELAGQSYLQSTGKLTMMNDMNEVIKTLIDSYGNNARVAVYPNADIQYCQ